MTTAKKIATYFFGAVLMLAALIYAAFPHLAVWTIEKNLPDNIELTYADIQRPSFDQLTVQSLQLNHLASHSKLSLDNIVIDFHLWSRSVNKVSIESLSVVSKPNFDNTDSNNETSNKTFELPKLPNVDLKQFDLKVLTKNMPSLVANGQLSVLDDHWKVRLTASQEDQLAANVDLSIVNNEINSAITVHTPSLHRVTQTLSSVYPIPNWLAQSDGQINANININAQWEKQDIQLKSSSIDLAMTGVKTEYEGFRLNDGSLSFIAEKKADQLSIQSAHTQFLLEHSLKPLIKKTLAIDWTLKHYKESNNTISIDHQLTVDKTQKATIHSLIDKQAFDTQNTIVWNLHDPFAYAKFDGFNLSSKTITGETILSTYRVNDRMTIEPKTSVINIEAFELKKKGIVTNSPKLSVNLSLSAFDTPALSNLIDASIKSSKTRVIFAEQKLQMIANLSGKITQIQPSHFSFIVNSKPTVEFNASSTETLITPQLSIDGKISDELNNLSMNLKGDIHIEKWKRTLRPLFEKPKWLEQMSINNGEGLTLHAAMEIMAPTFDQLTIKGALQSEGNRLEFNTIDSNKMSISLHWPTHQPWYSFQLSGEAGLLFDKLDRQNHQISTDIQSLSPITLANLHIQSTLLGGSAGVVGANEAQTLDSLAGTVSIENIDLGVVNKIINKPELNLSGRVSGTIPFYRKQNQLYFENGKLTSSEGNIQYLPEGKKKELTKENLSDIANITLQNFSYDSMTVEVLKGSPCAFDTMIRLDGKNPDLSSQSNQRFNIRYQPQSNANLYQLLFLGEEFVKEMRKESLGSGCVNENDVK